MSQSKKISLPENYQHQTDKRSQKQILLTNNLVRALTQLNLSKIEKKQISRQSSNTKFQTNNKYTFICITGVPKMDKEFENLQLPGQKIIHSVTGFIGNFSDAEYLQILKDSSFKKQSVILSQIINKISPYRKIVIIFHSFASFILLYYLQEFGDSKISGLIDMGGIPITIYSIGVRGIKSVQPFSMTELIEKRKQIYEKFKIQVYGKLGSPFKNQYHGYIFMTFLKEKKVEVIFQWARNYPKILKLIIFGRKDIIFQEKLLNQKAVHYCYTNKLPEGQEISLQNAYEKVYGEKVKNVQQRFIFNIESGGHSIHCQPKLTKSLNIMIRQYIEVLDAHLSAQKTQAKL